MDTRQLRQMRADAFMRIGEQGLTGEAPMPREAMAYSNGVLSLLFDSASEAQEWAKANGLSGQRHPQGMWREWKTYVNGVD